MPYEFIHSFLTFLLSLPQGKGEEGGESPQHQGKEQPVEGGLGGAVWSQALHRYSGSQQAERGFWVRAQPPPSASVLMSRVHSFSSLCPTLT